MPTTAARIVGFDWLRVLALLLVTVFHGLVLLDLQSWTRIAGMSLGSLGVSLFLALSGALIGNDNRPAFEWLVARLKKIFPAYWIATLLAFLATAASGYKPVSMVQFLWQISGIGLYYSEDLINVATWFIGLLLTLYFSVFLARLTRYSDLIFQGISIGSAGLVLLHSSSGFFGSCLAFFGGLLAFRTRVPVKSLIALAIPSAVLSGADREFLCIATVWSLLAASLAIRRVPPVIGWISKYSYEFYLCHGIFLVGCLKLLGTRTLSWQSVFALFVGILSAGFAAVLIQKAVSGSLARLVKAGGRG
ncbi:MAG: acyltransferase [Pirellula sp.]|jgi:peptidoglycan/LPS O-acetylase OafA/YrhL|nr:acyltransferase [Pirellula sp.]